MSTQEIVDVADAGRYEIHLDGRVAGFAEYRLAPAGSSSPDEPRRFVFTHTEVDPAYEGQGLGGKLARGALDDVRSRGGTVVPLCPFIKGYIDRHPEYQGLVDDR